MVCSLGSGILEFMGVKAAWSPRLSAFFWDMEPARHVASGLRLEDSKLQGLGCDVFRAWKRISKVSELGTERLLDLKTTSTEGFRVQGSVVSKGACKRIVPSEV